jgi:hypothetical protein
MRRNIMYRILIITEDSHLALALQVALTERSYLVRHEMDSRDALVAIKEFAPDAMITASEAAVFISRRNAADVTDLPRPLDLPHLRRVLETEPQGGDRI